MAEWIDIKKATPTADTEVQFRLKNSGTVFRGAARTGPRTGTLIFMVTSKDGKDVSACYDWEVEAWRLIDGSPDWQASFYSAEKSWNTERKRADQLEQELKELRAQAQTDLLARMQCHIQNIKGLARMNYELAACQALSDEERSEFRIIAHTQEALAERLERTLG